MRQELYICIAGGFLVIAGIFFGAPLWQIAIKKMPELANKAALGLFIGGLFFALGFTMFILRFFERPHASSTKAGLTMKE